MSTDLSAPGLPHYNFQLEFKVRDYECDMQGIVNNSVYQNYLEHTRHEFLLHQGVNFAALAQQGVNLVMTKAELLYKAPLRSGDRFWVGVSCKRKGRLRFVFNQGVYFQSGATALLATVEGTSLNAQGRPFQFGGLEEFAQLD